MKSRMLVVVAALAALALAGCGGGGGGAVSNLSRSASLGSGNQISTNGYGGYYQAYTFIADKTGTLVVSELGVGESHPDNVQGFDPYLWVAKVNSDGTYTYIDENDEPEVADPVLPGGDDAQITWQATAGQKYIVYAGEDEEEDPGPYTLKFNGVAIRDFTPVTAADPDNMNKAATSRRCTKK